MIENPNIEIVVADIQHAHYAQEICDLIAEAALIRGTGIAKRTAVYVESKIRQGKSVIALHKDRIIGFCYIETWEHDKYVANSGLIVHPEYRGLKLAYKIKSKILDLSHQLFPGAKVFGITTSNAVLNINFKLGYRPVTFSELTADPDFWEGCKGCVNYDILKRTDKKMCLCTGMIYEHNKKVKQESSIQENVENKE